MTAWNSSFTLLTRTGLAATFDLVMPSAPSRSLILNSVCRLPRFSLFPPPSFFLTWPHFSERWRARPLIESMTFDLSDRPTCRGMAEFERVNEWRGKGHLAVKWCLSRGLRGKWPPTPFAWVISLINDGSGGRGGGITGKTLNYSINLFREWRKHKNLKSLNSIWWGCLLFFFFLESFQIYFSLKVQ